jgi:hypothetical protein
MKKILVIALLVLLLAALAAAPALAKPGMANVKGEVTAVGAGTLTLLTAQGETVTVTVPAGFDLASFAVGDRVLVKGSPQPDGSILAAWIKEIGPRGEDDDPGDGGEGRLNGAYCSAAKPLKMHPVAVKLATRYGVTPEWVMGHFCSGHGMGAIMLALKMAEIHDADPDTLLAARAAGMGWGQIWKEEGWIGSERQIESPPGQLKKPENAGPKKNK